MIFRLLTPVLLALALAVFAASCRSASEREGASLLGEAETAIVAPDKAARIKSAKLLYSLKTEKDGASRIIVRFKFPDKYRFDLISETEAEVACLDGNRGWSYEKDKGVEELDEDDCEFLRSNIATLPFSRNFTKVFSRAEKIGEAETGGEICDIVLCTPANINLSTPVKLWIGKNTKLILRSEMISGDGTLTIQFFDYADYDGVKLASCVIDDGTSSGLSMIKLLSVDWNSDIDDADFSKPEVPGKETDSK